MTNNYVPDLSQLGAGDIARSQDVNDRYENTVAGFDRLPVPKNGEQGFSAPVPVGEPVNSDHAVTKNWAETGMTSQLALAEAEATDAAASAAAALASEQAAAGSESTASTAAGTATTKASEASTSAANALASENAAALSETAAGLSEAAADADRIAAQSAKTDAETAKTAAEAAQVAAELAYDSFDDRYLGPKAADPSLDNDGNALLTGALYFDTNNDDMKVYNGSAWVAAYIPPENLTLQEVTDNGATSSTAISLSGAFTASNSSVNFTNIGTTTATTDPFVTLTAAGLMEKRTLGSLAFSSATYDNYQGWQLNGGTSTETINKNETVTFVGSGGASVTNSGNTVTINSTDTNTTNFNVQANSGTAENISAGETINFTGSGGVTVTRTGNSFDIDGSSAGITDVVSDTTPQLGGTLDANGNIIDMGTNTITDTKVGQWDAAYGDKVNTVAFNTGTGVLTLNRQDGGTVTEDLDGRYPTNDGTGATGTWGVDISGNAATATSASAAPFSALTSKTSGTGTYTTTVAFNAPLMTTDKVNAKSNTQLVLNAGESNTYASGQTGEAIYLNAENGIVIESSPDNWVSAWAGRNTCVINNASGNSSFPGNISVTGTVDGRDVAADGVVLDAATNSNTGSTIVKRDANGDSSHRYVYTSYVNMSHGASTRSSETIFYSSTDNFIRKNNATGFRASLNVPTRTGGDASGTWGIDISGNAATATWADTVDVNSGNTSNAWYDLVWHSGDTVYSTTTIEAKPNEGKIRANGYYIPGSTNATVVLGDGTTGTASNSAGNGTFVKRTGSGYIYANYFNTTPNDIADGSVTSFCAESGNDGFIRHVKAGPALTFLQDGAATGTNLDASYATHLATKSTYIDQAVTSTPTRGDSGHHFIQVWQAALTLTLNDSSWERGDIITICLAGPVSSLSVASTVMYINSTAARANADTVTLSAGSAAGKRVTFFKYAETAGYWMCLV